MQRYKLQILSWFNRRRLVLLSSIVLSLIVVIVATLSIVKIARANSVHGDELLHMVPVATPGTLGYELANYASGDTINFTLQWDFYLPSLHIVLSGKNRSL